jgi:hypothetical protein
MCPLVIETNANNKDTPNHTQKTNLIGSFPLFAILDLEASALEAESVLVPPRKISNGLSDAERTGTLGSGTFGVSILTGVTVVKALAVSVVGAPNTAVVAGTTARVVSTLRGVGLRRGATGGSTKMAPSGMPCAVNFGGAGVVVAGCAGFGCAGVAVGAVAGVAGCVVPVAGVGAGVVVGGCANATVPKVKLHVSKSQQERVNLNDVVKVVFVILALRYIFFVAILRMMNE